MSWPSLIFRLFKLTTVLVCALTADHLLFDGRAARQIVTGFRDVTTDPVALLDHILPRALTRH